MSGKVTHRLHTRDNRTWSGPCEMPRSSPQPEPGRRGRNTTARTVSLTRLQFRRSARAAESARLEIVCWATNRGFKSHLLRSPGLRAPGRAGALRCPDTSEAPGHRDGQAGSRLSPVTVALPYLAISTAETSPLANDDDAMTIALAEARAA